VALKKQKNQSDDDILIEQGERIRALHKIISRPDLSFDEQIDETLKLGCRLLGTEVGKVGKQDPENNTSEFLNIISVSDIPVKRGIVMPLDKTFCHITFSSPQAVSISHVSQSEYKDHPAASFLGMESYIGTSINIHGKKFGTINFSSRTPVARAFTEADVDLVNLMGSWISVMMERQLEAEELKQSKLKADAANKAKSSFLANMSHEIRTPLTSIIGFAELAISEDQDMAERMNALITIHNSGNHLLNLINDILDFSKIEADELVIEKQNTDILSILNEVESILTVPAKNKQLNFSIEIDSPVPEKINTDALRLKQILINLGGNAIKFTDKGKVKLSVGYDKDNDSIYFAISDTGIGMTLDQIQNVFKAFKQADASISRRFGGTGLGLSLSKRLTELLDGNLEVESTAGKGSTFTLTLTHACTDKDGKIISNIDSYRKEDTTATNKLKGSVLLAEDNELNQQLIKKYLTGMGLSVDIAENGLEAVDATTDKSYDIIFMDMQMPVMSGLDAVKSLRKKKYTGTIIMLTANATSGDRTICLNAGSDDYVTKPINRVKLYETCSKYLDSADS